jgi:preprotein translocase subunit SecB
MHSTTERSLFHRKPSLLLTNTPYTQSKPKILSHQGIYIGSITLPLPDSPDSFEEGKMANISPTIKIDISIKSGVIEEITIGAACSLEEITAYKDLF